MRLCEPVSAMICSASWRMVISCGLPMFTGSTTSDSHQPEDPVHEVGHVAEAARLAAVAEDGDVLVAQRLAQEGRDRAAVLDPHARAVGVEDPHDARLARRARGGRPWSWPRRSAWPRRRRRAGPPGSRCPSSPRAAGGPAGRRRPRRWRRAGSARSWPWPGPARCACPGCRPSGSGWARAGSRWARRGSRSGR